MSNSNGNSYNNVHSAVLVALPLRQFTQFIWQKHECQAAANWWPRMDITHITCMAEVEIYSASDAYQELRLSTKFNQSSNLLLEYDLKCLMSAPRSAKVYRPNKTQHLIYRQHRIYIAVGCVTCTNNINNN